MKILVTGAAGFIGFHTARRLIERGDRVVGLDVVNDYYDPALKEARIRVLEAIAGAARGSWTFMRADLADQGAVTATFAAHGFDRVIHLAAQAGVRHSLTHPHDYVQSNIVGFTNILEACRHNAHRSPDLRLDLLGLWRQHQACRFRSTAAWIIRCSSMRRRNAPTS